MFVIKGSYAVLTGFVSTIVFYEDAGYIDGVGYTYEVYDTTSLGVQVEASQMVECLGQGLKKHGMFEISFSYLSK